MPGNLIRFGRSGFFALCVYGILGTQFARAAPSGTLLITPEPIEAGANYDARLAKASVKILERKSEGEPWAMSFVAYLSRASTAADLNLVFYDKSDPKEAVNAFPFSTTAGSKAVSSSVTFSGDQGFKAGKTYLVYVTRLVGGKEEIFARTTLTLK